MRTEKIVAIGGGTGLSTMLKGLKLHTKNITAIVTVADDGGSSGMLRNDFGMLPPGDVRNCISALSDENELMTELLSYRFKEGALAGHSLGNLILAALNEMSSSFDEAVEKLCGAFGIVGSIYPVTNENVTLSAILDSGKVIKGESNIGSHDPADGRISSVYLTPSHPKAVPGVIKAINNADIIVLGPGSLYTSIIPNLLVDGVVDAIKNSSAPKIYVANLMTQPGETDDFTLYDHLKAIEKHSYEGIADYIIANNAPIPSYILEKYEAENARQVVNDIDRITGSTALVQGNLALVRDGRIRHNFSRLARVIMYASRVSSGHNSEN